MIIMFFFNEGPKGRRTGAELVRRESRFLRGASRGYGQTSGKRSHSAAVPTTLWLKSGHGMRYGVGEKANMEIPLRRRNNWQSIILVRIERQRRTRKGVMEKW